MGESKEQPVAEPARAEQYDEPAQLTYADFGRRFFETAVTRERVAKAVGDLAGRPIEVGPMNITPLGFVKVRANGAVGEPAVEPRPHPEHVAYTLTIPAKLTLEIQIGLETYRFDAESAIDLAVVARAIDPLAIYIDVTPPEPADIRVALEADGLGATVIDKLANIEREVRRNVSKFVRKEIEKSRDSRVIDIGGKVAGKL
jgi:hypothetical protein